MSKRSCILDIKEIRKILPHSYPFLLVDKVTELDLDKGEIVGIKNVTVNEPFFPGHFPHVPIMPGVLILEALAQTGGILVHQKGYDQKIAVLLNVSEAKFRRAVGPGDVLELRVKGLHISSTGGKMEAKAMLGDKVAASAVLSFALVDKEKL